MDLQLKAESRPAYGRHSSDPSSEEAPSKAGRRRIGDSAFHWATKFAGLLLVLLILWIGVRLYLDSAQTRNLFGLSILTKKTWDIPHNLFGAEPFIYGTIVSSIVALILAVPIGVGAALFLSEVAPKKLAGPVSFLIELLAAVPSIIYGLWGFLVLCPFLLQHISPWLHTNFGSIPLFGGNPALTNMLAAGCILAIMILPFIASVSYAVLKSVPKGQRESATGLGATRWEVVRHIAYQEAKGGIVGGIILGLGRAIGETMAVVLVIGNTAEIKASLLQPAYTMPALLANQFNEAYDVPIQRSALLEIALILFVITLIVNGGARMLIYNTQRRLAQRGLAGAKAPSEWGPRLKQWFLIAIGVGIVSYDFMRKGLGALTDGALWAVLVVAGAVAFGQYMEGKPQWPLIRRWVSRGMSAVLGLCAILGCFVLAALLYYVAAKGLPGINSNLFTKLPAPPGIPGGLKSAIVGTLMLIGIAGVIGIPIGLLGGVYLAEFGKGRFAHIVRYCADVLNGIPSVVIGLFAYAAFVLPFGNFSAWAGGGALAVMMIPTIVRTTEEMLRLVPLELREASIGLGAGKVQTIRHVVIPAARSGIVTGVMLATARIAGETAPLLFTAFGSDLMELNPSKPISSLTMKIYEYAQSPYPDQISQAWSGALVLLTIIVILSGAARWATRGRAMSVR